MNGDDDFRFVDTGDNLRFIEEGQVAIRRPVHSDDHSVAAMSAFDKFCAAFAFVIGILLLILETLGFFLGSSAHFTLPPILGFLPALVGWGIVKSLRVAWGSRKVIK